MQVPAGGYRDWSRRYEKGAVGSESEDVGQIMPASETTGRTLDFTVNVMGSH